MWKNWTFAKGQFAQNLLFCNLMKISQTWIWTHICRRFFTLFSTNSNFDNFFHSVICRLEMTVLTKIFDFDSVELFWFLNAFICVPRPKCITFTHSEHKESKSLAFSLTTPYVAIFDTNWFEKHYIGINSIDHLKIINSWITNLVSNFPSTLKEIINMKNQKKKTLREFIGKMCNLYHENYHNVRLMLPTECKRALLVCAW